MNRRLHNLVASSLGALCVVPLASAIAQTVPAPALRQATPPTPTVDGRSSQPLSRAQTLARLSRTLDICFDGQPLADVVRFLELHTDLILEPLWDDSLDTRHSGTSDPGLDPAMPVHLDARGLTTLQCLEAILADAAVYSDLPSGATWQCSPQNRVEFGPRERLNRPEARRLETYDVRDLVARPLPSRLAPRLSLDAVLSTPGADGSPFDRESAGFWPTRDPRSEDPAATDLVNLITTTIEPEQWVRNGGDAATIRYTDGVLVVVAPDYVHRGLAGLPTPTELTHTDK